VCCRLRREFATLVVKIKKHFHEKAVLKLRVALNKGNFSPAEEVLDFQKEFCCKEFILNRTQTFFLLFYVSLFSFIL
jgi:hypothetical protein